MKRANRFTMALIAALGAAVIAGCSHKPDADDKPAGASANKGPAEDKAGVTLDAETQERIGIKTEMPAPAQWQPVMRVIGHVADPLAFVASATAYETARAAATASQADLARTRKLAEQDNASARVLEAAQAAAARDALALTAARAKFRGDWGVKLAAQTNLTAVAERLQTDDVAYVKLTLPVGAFPNPLPANATCYVLGNETNAIAAEFADDLGIDAATQVQSLLFLVKQKLPPNLSVDAELKTSEEALNGLVVPASAVIRHEGKGWVYVQTGTNQFARAEVPLNHYTGTGWFISGELSATNQIVVIGAQTVLSAELSGGAFTTGERD